MQNYSNSDNFFGDFFHHYKIKKSSAGHAFGSLNPRRFVTTEDSPTPDFSDHLDSSQVNLKYVPQKHGF